MSLYRPRGGPGPAAARRLSRRAALLTLLALLVIGTAPVSARADQHPRTEPETAGVVQPAPPEGAPAGSAPAAGVPAAPPAEAYMPDAGATAPIVSQPVAVPAAERGTVADVDAPSIEGVDPTAVAGEAPAPEAELQPASTLELLDEDTRLERGEDHAGPAGEPVGEEAPAGTGQAPDGQDGTPEQPARVADEPVDPSEEPAGNAGIVLFPTSPGIEKQKAFWIRIFAHHNSDQGVIHDGRIALPVYEDLDLTGMSYRAQRNYVRARKRELAARLRELSEAVAAGTALSEEQQALLDRVPPGSSPQDLREFAENVRFQRGLADRFKAGLIRSGAVMEHILRSLDKYDVPRDLAYLPHVESSFNNTTLSKYGAAGIWQFTRGTGRSFMTVGYEVDERYDPIVASEAAAKFLRQNFERQVKSGPKLLRQNFERLGTWPLAITAYNHGPQSLGRITRRMGTSDLGVLIEQYDGHLFKFASKNFYAEFLAAREVARNHEQYFGPVELEPTLTYREVPLDWYVPVEEAAEALDMRMETLRRLNPGLRHAVWSGAKYIPPGYVLRIPSQHAPADFLAALPEDARYSKQKRSSYVRVSRGDTLYGIGRRHGISWRSIALANNITRYNRLRPGQRLILPWSGSGPPPVVAEAESEARAPLAESDVVARIPVEPKGPWRAGQPAAGQAPEAHTFQELRVITFDAGRKEGEIVAAYGETFGAYADWAGVTAQELRRVNGLSSRSVLRPGSRYLIPLDNATAQQFEAQRLAFHRDREHTFFAEYDITEKVKVAVRRGQSPWALAQQNNVPMWLFYRENPQLLTEPLRAGMEVILPVVQAGARATQ